MKKLLLIIFITVLIGGCSQSEKILPPTNIRLEGDTIYFSEVSNAEQYEIEINSVKYKIDINQYKLVSSGTYMVRVRSIGKDDNYSNYSTLYVFKYDAEIEIFDPYIIDGNNKEYVVGEDLAINFAYPAGYFIKSITAPNNDIDKNEYTIDGNKVILKDSFLKRKFEEDRQSLILAFIVSNDEHQFLINVFIKEQNN